MGLENGWIYSQPSHIGEWGEWGSRVADQSLKHKAGVCSRESQRDGGNQAAGAGLWCGHEVRSRKGGIVPTCRRHTPCPSPCKRKKKKKRKKKRKRKKIPCSQWCRMLAWGNRAKRPTDSEGKEEAMTNRNWQERRLPARPGKSFTLDWGQLCKTRLSKSNQVQLFLYFLLQWSLGSVTAETSLQILLACSFTTET